ncbi:hypothetical protein [Rhodohalobacter sp. 8-1]|uniref:hypothetical protein n=1 Tax=Rhodohalobacter sp. 8-1 TaxID=3131972 RepID=UPI0030ECEFE1
MLATKTMNDHELTWYMQEISMHSLGADLAFKALIDAINNSETRQTRLVWFHLSSFLAHAAMISKYLSPINPRGTKIDRMNELRDKLNVDIDSEVLPRNARDNIEHFDERIDNWVGSENTILEIVLDNRRAFDYLDVNSKNVKRVLLQEELIFVSEKRDESKFELELEPLITEIRRIGEEATSWIDDSSPYNFIYPE